MNSKIIKGVADYYAGKLSIHGDTPQGVDWNSIESQYLRFKQLCKIIRPGNPFSLLDYGCGYAELVNYLFSEFDKDSFTYHGYDVSEKMIEQAKKLFGTHENVQLSTTLPENKFDYIVASGIFNVKLDLADENDWLSYFIETLDSFNEKATKGFSFNALTKYSDKPFMKEYLYYADPLYLFDYCKRNYSRNVALLHDYELYEFTILVRK